jgi:plastocyanin
MMHKILLTTSILVVAALFVFLGCNNGSTSPYGTTASTTTTKTAPNTVTITNYTFSPASLTVTKGTVVTWQNNDGVAHTSTNDNGAWDTGTIVPGGSKTTTFSTAGTFTYHCTVHPMMTGTIIVQ